jgi:hypothetical protein
MKRRVITLTESQLKKVIEKMIEEADIQPTNKFQPGQKFQQGQQQGFASGKQAQIAVLNAGREAMKGAKQVIVTIGKVTFTVITYGVAFIYLIGKSLYKVGAAIGNAILKFISATGRAAVGAATAVGDATINGLKVAGVAIEKGAQVVSSFVASLKDQSIAIVKWVINLFKQFGNALWGKLLIAAGSIKEFSSALGTWLKDSYSAVAQEVGLAWDRAMQLGAQGINALKSGVSNAVDSVKSAASTVGNKISSTAANIGNKIAGGLGSAAGWVKGFLSEMFERYFSMENFSTSKILSECVKYNGKIIL